MIFTEEHELDVLRACAHDVRYMTKASNLLQQHLFLSKAHGWLFGIMLEQYKAHAETPTELYAKTAIDRVKDKTLQQQYATIIQSVFQFPPSSPLSSLDTLIQFVRFRLLQTSVTEVLDELGKGNIDQAYNKITDVLYSGKVKSTTEVNWIEELEQRQSERKQQRINPRSTVCVPTRIRELDKVIDGLREGELGLVVGTTNRGKSIFLVHLGLMAAVSGWNVLHITLEMPAHQIATRYDSRLLKIPHKKLKNYDLNPIEEELIKHTIERRRKEFKDKVFIVNLPVRSCNTTHLRDIMKQRIAEGHRPHVVLVDSGDHMNPVRSTQNFRLDTSSVFWELKALAEDPEMGCAVWSSTHAKAELKYKLIHSEGVSESYDKARIADIILTLNQTEEQELMVPPEVDLWLAKHRDGESKKRITLKAAFSIMMFQENKPLEIVE